MLAIVTSAALSGIEASPVEVEVNSGETGEPKPVMVGLPTTAVKESIDRVWSALANSGRKLPQMKATINLAPGHLRKEGPLYDLPIALGLLKATGQLHSELLSQFLVAGELGLSGQCRPIRGGLAMALCAKALGLKGLLLPARTAEEAALVRDVEVYAVDSLDAAGAFLEGRHALTRVEARFPSVHNSGEIPVDFSELKGQHGLRRAIEIAVGGFHNLLIIGPPGSGKSMAAKRIPTIMPELSEQEYLDILRIYSAGGMTLERGLKAVRPFRSPHHTISDVGLIGGGSIPGPGEISLAHHGVLFLDELPEFKRSALEVLRQPLEDAQVTISRSAGKITLPARFMLVAAMNPTPCGADGGNSRSTPSQIQRYRSRVSGPLLDRFDLHIEAPALSLDELNETAPGENSKCIRERVLSCRERQRQRFKNDPWKVNAAMPPAAIRRHCKLSPAQGALLRHAMERLNLSARAYDRILKVARTIADLADTESLLDAHLMEAIQYRSLDRSANY